jgi:hypothetical protein
MYKKIYVFSISLIAFICLFYITASAQNVVVKPNLTKATIRLLDDIAMGSENSQSTKHVELLVKMGNNIDGFVPLINKYRIPEQRNILVDILRSKGLAQSTETLVIKGKLAKGELKEYDLINAIQNNSRI